MLEETWDSRGFCPNPARALLETGWEGGGWRRVGGHLPMLHWLAFWATLLRDVLGFPGTSPRGPHAGP